MMPPTNCNLEARLDTRNAALHLGLSQSTLRKARSTGQLCGVEGPRYSKLGYRVVYSIKALNEWLAQFSDQICTTEEPQHTVNINHQNKQLLLKTAKEILGASVNGADSFESLLEINRTFCSPPLSVGEVQEVLEVLQGKNGGE